MSPTVPLPDLEREAHAPWPKRRDGKLLRIGEMTPAERRTQFRAATLRALKRISQPQEAS